MKTLPQKDETRCRSAWRGVEARRSLRILLAGALGIFVAASPINLDAGGSATAAIDSSRTCRKVVLRGEVAAGQEWRAAVGEGWVFRVMPIVTPSLRSSTKVAADNVASGQSYTGWDLVMDREPGDGYPDALLLATPPYGSVSEREVGTTFGMRAQDAIAWEPRQFRFFTSMDRVRRARALYREIFTGTRNGAGADHAGKAADKAAGKAADKASGRASGNAFSKEAANAPIELLNLISSDPEMGHGQFSITDARLVLGSGDPPAYASAWVAHLSRVPHTVEQRSAQDLQHVGAVSSELGELRSIQFIATLWLPSRWKAPSEIDTKVANCAE